MPKLLKDILNGVKKSTVTPGSIGVDPGVDYKPKAGGEQKFVKKHSIEKHASRAGNKEDIFQGTHVKYSMDTPQMKNFGHKKGEDEKVYGEETELKCNKSPKGTKCPVHGMMECSGSYTKKTLKEVLTKKTSAGEIIKDFENSKNPKFSGKSKEERERMALGAYYGMHPEKSKYTKEEMSINENSNKIKAALRDVYDLNGDHGRISSANMQKYKLGTRHSRGMPFDIALDHVSAHHGIPKEDLHVAYHKEVFPLDKEGPEKIKKGYESGDVKEDLAMPLLGGDVSDLPKGRSDDTQEEIEMVKAELKALANKALHILTAMPHNLHVEPWVQAKIAQSREMINSVHDYMVYGDHGKEEDEQAAPSDGGISSVTMAPNSFGAPSSQFGDGRI